MPGASWKNHHARRRGEEDGPKLVLPEAPVGPSIGVNKHFEGKEAPDEGFCAKEGKNGATEEGRGVP